MARLPITHPSNWSIGPRSPRFHASGKVSIASTTETTTVTKRMIAATKPRRATVCDKVRNGRGDSERPNEVVREVVMPEALAILAARPVDLMPTSPPVDRHSPPTDPVHPPPGTPDRS